jgi:phosphatidylserine decarboxylase
MTVRAGLARIVAHEALNFAVTNRLPRRALTRFVGWFSRIEQPLVRDASIGLWRLFCDVDLTDAEPRRYASMRDCFTRRLVAGARPPDPDPAVIASPCDAIVGTQGPITGDEVHQIKGMPYSLAELLGSAPLAERMIGGSYVTLRLTAGMYHRFHAPYDLQVEEVRYFPGDCWNVNPPALKRVPRLFCRNERAAIRCRMDTGEPLILVPVAAILVSSLRLTFVDLPAGVRNGGSTLHAADAHLAKGEEMGWFEQGSTIVMLVPAGWSIAAGEGEQIRCGAALARRGEPRSAG